MYSKECIETVLLNAHDILWFEIRILSHNYPFLVELGNFHTLLMSADFFPKSSFSKNLLNMNTVRVSISLEPDQDQQSVSPDLGPNCL